MKLDRTTLARLMLFTALMGMQPRPKARPVLLEQHTQTRKASRKKRGKSRRRR